MMKFEIVEAYKNIIDESFIPVRSTEGSAGYDILAAEDTIVPSIFTINDKLLKKQDRIEMDFGKEPYTLKAIDEIINTHSNRATLIPTGLKACMPEGKVLSIRSRSSMPYKHLLIVANGPSTIDADFHNNPQNEGHISVMLINLSVYDILIEKGDKIAQFIFESFYTTDDEEIVTAKRNGGYGSTGK